MAIKILGPVENESLTQGQHIEATRHRDGGVVTALQLSAGATGNSTSVIGVASEAYNNDGGSNALVGAESAVVDLGDGSNPHPKYGHDSVAKVHMDGVIWTKERELLNSAAYHIDAQKHVKWQHGIKIEPRTVARTLIFARGVKVPVLDVSGEMVIWKDGTAHLPVIIDETLWGLRLTKL